jgi:hypothetical protein
VWPFRMPKGPHTLTVARPMTLDPPTKHCGTTSFLGPVGMDGDPQFVRDARSTSPSMPPVGRTKGRGKMQAEQVSVQIEIVDLEQPTAPVVHMPAHSKHRSRP